MRAERYEAPSSESSATNGGTNPQIARGLIRYSSRLDKHSPHLERFLHLHIASMCMGTLRVNVERVDDFDENVCVCGLDRVLDPGLGERIGLGAGDNGLFADFADFADLYRRIPDAAPGSRINRRNQPIS